MSKIKLVSWNVNGIRAVSKKGFFEWMEETRPDILGLQETKISSDQLTEELIKRKGYKSYFSHAEKRGYSGVALYTKEEPISVQEGFGVPRFDSEGRTLVADFGDFVIANIYFPNGAQNEERLQYKLDFYDAFYKWANKLVKEGKKLTVCGDYNTAHKAIDLARPKENEKISGFLPVERAWMDKFVKAGWSDTFRLINDKPDQYSWWHMRTNARERNVGWRIDYFFTSKNLTDQVDGATIEQHVLGSDHCPVTLTLKI
jgi:exodeoxyribonuclease III